MDVDDVDAYPQSPDLRTGVIYDADAPIGTNHFQRGFLGTRYIGTGPRDSAEYVFGEAVRIGVRNADGSLNHEMLRHLEDLERRRDLTDGGRY